MNYFHYAEPSDFLLGAFISFSSIVGSAIIALLHYRFFRWISVRWFSALFLGSERRRFAFFLWLVVSTSTYPIFLIMVTADVDAAQIKHDPEENEREERMVVSVELSSNGNRTVVLDQMVIFGSTNKFLALYNVSTGKSTIVSKGIVRSVTSRVASRTPNTEPVQD